MKSRTGLVKQKAVSVSDCCGAPHDANLERPRVAWGLARARPTEGPREARALTRWPIRGSDDPETAHPAEREAIAVLFRRGHCGDRGPPRLRKRRAARIARDAVLA